MLVKRKITCISASSLLSPLEKGMALHFPFTNLIQLKMKNYALCQFWLKLAQWFCRRSLCERFSDNGQPDRQRTDNWRVVIRTFNLTMSIRCWTALLRLNHTSGEFVRNSFLRNFKNLLQNMKIERYLENIYYICRLGSLAPYILPRGSLLRNRCPRPYALPSNKVNNWYCYMVLLLMFSYKIHN